MATIDIGKIKPVFKGTYDNSASYVLDDIVYYNGSSYVAKTSTTGNLPTDTTKWNVLASGSGGIWDSTLSIGSTGQVVKVGSGGALEFGDDQGGKIGQVVTSVMGYEQQTSSTSLVDVLSASGVVWESAITPSATSSKILVLPAIYVRNHRTNGAESRNTIELQTKIGSGSYAMLDRAYEIGQYMYDGNGAIVAQHWHPTILHSPNTTSEVKYKFQYLVQDSSAIISTNWAGSPNIHQNRVTMMEVLA